MIGDVQSHQTTTEMIRAATREVDAGADVPLKVKVSCSSPCDLRGKTVRIVAHDSTVAEGVALTRFEEEMNETDEFTVKAPTELGECTWSAVFPAQEIGGVLHEESSTPVVFKVKPHATSIAVWDVPSPIPFNDRFKIKVGVKCSSECKLTGKKIGIYGPRGKKVATGVLGGVPWPGTSALYWAEVELEAPGLKGYYKWRVGFRNPQLEVPHAEASYRFAFATARPPEHIVTVQVTDKLTKSPIENAQVTLRSRGTPYRAWTDEGGVASLGVPTGEYRVYVVKHRYADFQATAEVGSDLDLKAELLLTPPSQWGGWPNR